MENENGWEQRVEMNIECIAPLHVVTASSSGGYQILVRHKPENRCDDRSSSHGVDKYNPNDKLHASDDPDLRNQGKNDGRKHEKNAQKNEERGVIPSPLVFRPLTMLKVQIDFLRGDAEVDELPNGKFKIHLTKHEYPSEVFVSLFRG